MQNVYTGFRKGLVGLDKNEILLSKEDKNDILCQLFIDQVAKEKHFTIVENPYGEDTCTECNGVGFKMLFHRELSVRVCLKCDEGLKTIPCRKCQNGRYTRSLGNGSKMNVLCKFCNGTKKRQVKCKTCRGTGELRKMVITPKIKSLTPCKHCHELGFIDKDLFAIIEDTKKFEDAADQLVDAMLANNESTADNPDASDGVIS